MANYIICVRNNNGGNFGTLPGKTKYFNLEDDSLNLENYKPSNSISSNAFLKSINPDNQSKDIIVFVHGYNNGIEDVLNRHKELKEGLSKFGFKGDLISFDWPSDDKALMYLPDRHKAKNTAFELVKGGIKLLSDQYSRKCNIKIHAIAHSTGAYIIREAFDDARTTDGPADTSWTLGQLLFIAGDVSSTSLKSDDAKTIYAHCNRFTNYYNQHDEILAISNAKRLGFENRVGRVGLPSDVPNSAVDVNCSDYYINKVENLNIKVGAKSHSWYFYSDTWYKDVISTIQGMIDRNVIPTRDNIDGTYKLKINI